MKKIWPEEKFQGWGMLNEKLMLLSESPVGTTVKEASGATVSGEMPVKEASGMPVKKVARDSCAPQ